MDWTYFANLARDEETQRNNQLRDLETDAENRINVGRGRINDASRTLSCQFADSQLGGGSAPAEGFGRLKDADNKALLATRDNATGQSNQLKQSNEAQRGQLLRLLDSGVDPSTVVQHTVSGIDSVPRTPQYSPLGDIFSNVTGQFATAENAYSSGYPGWGFGVRPKPNANAGGGTLAYGASPMSIVT
jgi:hypothetical protein